MQALSKKQIESFRDSTSRINIWEGSVRSGKSFISIIRFLQALKNGPEGLAMIIGVSRDAIQRNVLVELCGLVGAPVPTPKSSQMTIFGRTVFFVGANDERAQRRIQGSTLAVAYCDEVTLLPSGFFKMLLSRLSVPGAQLFGTTNPDSPYHWLKTEFLSRTDLDMRVFHFRLEDNPSLEKHYIESLKKEYVGLWYKRYIEGQWVLAEGTVYDFFDEAEHVIDVPPGPAAEYYVGVDYGTKNPCVFTLVGYNPKLWPNIWLEKEYYYDSQSAGRQKTDTEYAEDLAKFIAGKPVRGIYIDPSAASFKLECSRQGILHLRDADNDVLNGIRFQSQLLSNGTFKVCRCCSATIREFGTYRWDEKVGARGEDKPIKQFDHCFVAGTQVITSEGPCPIEEIRKGDVVRTRSGFNRVMQTFHHRAAVKSYELFGQTLTATPEHQVMTGRGWVSLQDITHTDMLYIEPGENQWWMKSSSKDVAIDATPSPSMLICETTIKLMEQKLQRGFDISIEIFGEQLTAKFPTDTIFITKTGIPSTMPLAILSASALRIILPSIRKILQKSRDRLEEITSIGFEPKPPSGTGRKRGEHGIVNTSKDVSSEKCTICHANNAASHSKPENQLELGFVRITVRQHGEEIITLTMRKEVVFGAEKYLSSTDTLENDAAAEAARPNSDGMTDVYNLHVENENEFFANGFLVHNCMDSLRYVLFTHFIGKFGNRVSAEDIEQAWRKAAGVSVDLPEFFRTDHQHPMPTIGF